MNARAAEVKRDLMKAQMNITVLRSRKMLLRDMVSSLIEESFSDRFEITNLRADFFEMTSLVQQMKKGVKKLLSTVSANEQKTYDNIINAV